LNKKLVNYGGILISLAALFYAFSDIRWDTVREQILLINPWYYGLTMLLMILSIFVRAWRWQYIIKPLGATRVGPLYRAVMIGYFGNNVLPFRLGELLRAYAAAKYTGISTVKLLPTVVADRIMDLFSFFIVFVIMSAGMTLPDWAGKTKGTLFAVILLLILGLWVYRSQSVRITLWLSDRKGRLGRMLKELHLSLASLFKMDDYLKILSSSLLLWFIYGFHYFIGFKAFGLSLGVGEAALVLATSTFAVSIPSAPGALGTYHSGLVAILGFLAVEKSSALAFAVMMHLSGFIPITLIGAWYFWRSGVSIHDVK